MQRWSRLAVTLAGLGVIGLSGCTVEQSGGPVPGATSGGSAATSASAEEVLIKIDGSSTVAPISMAVAEAFGDTHPHVTPKVNVSGTGGGFEAFAQGRTDISNASRPIKSSEAEACKAGGVEFVELMIATDGLTVVVHPQNDWCTALTIDQLAEIWKKDSPVSKWSDIDPSWPAEPIKLFGADAKSGTYDYFKEVTVGKDVAMRVDYQPNTDDNVLVTGVAGDRYALGFFGYAYYVESTDKVKAVAIAPKGKTAAEAVAPTQATIEDGSYSPLSRPLFIYVNLASMQRPEIREFAEFHLSDEGQSLVELKKYIKLNAEQLAASRASLEKTLASLTTGE